MATKLPNESFVALAAVAWADGRMSKDESAGLVKAAENAGLEGDDLAAVQRATKEKVALDAFDASKLSAWERLVTYGLASWLSRVDGVQQGAELDSLRALAAKLTSSEVTDHKLAAAAAVAFDVAMQPKGRRPEKYDFVAFEKTLKDRFPKT
jgi:hypothetical protein